MTGDDSESTVKNVFYTLQADYSRYQSKLENPRHGKNYFAYGYVGKFTPSIDDTTFTDTNPFFWEAYDVYVLDENGDRIPILDQYGNPVLDDNGNELF